MKRNKFVLPPWAQGFKPICRQFIVPLCIFQGLRTILIPTIFDVLLLTAMILIALALHFELF